MLASRQSFQSARLILILISSALLVATLMLASFMATGGVERTLAQSALRHHPPPSGRPPQLSMCSHREKKGGRQRGSAGRRGRREESDSQSSSDSYETLMRLSSPDSPRGGVRWAKKSPSSPQKRSQNTFEDVRGVYAGGEVAVYAGGRVGSSKAFASNLRAQQKHGESLGGKDWGDATYASSEDDHESPYRGSRRPDGSGRRSSDAGGRVASRGERQSRARDESDLSPVGSVGLVNLGNTCYMNSVLQCLFALDALKEYYIGGVYEERRRALPAAMRNTMTTSDALRSLFAYAWDGGSAPAGRGSSAAGQHSSRALVRTLHQAFSEHNDEFPLRHQHDAHEFWTALRAAILEEAGRLEGALQLRPAARSPGADRLEGAFAGQLCSAKICTVCGHEGVSSRSIFETISLPLQVEADAPAAGGAGHSSSGHFLAKHSSMRNASTRNASTRNSSTRDSSAGNASRHSTVRPPRSLSAYLADFFDARQDFIDCDACRQRQHSLISFRVDQSPPMLVVHLKRFESVVNSRGEWRRAKKSSVEVVIEGEVTLAPHMRAQRRRPLGEEGRQGEDSYELAALICHFGTLDGGHYVAYVYNPISAHWMLHDDANVSVAFSERGGLFGDRAVRRSAFLLFYQKRLPF